MFLNVTLNHLQKTSHDYFNDWISKLYQCSILGFCGGICFIVSALAKKNAEVIKFLRILKKYVSENKLLFCSRKKSNVLLNKKVIFVFHTIFKLDFMTQIIYCIIYRCLCSHFILFLFCEISLYELKHRNNVNLSLFIHWPKVNNNHKMNEKRRQGYQSMDPK